MTKPQPVIVATAVLGLAIVSGLAVAQNSEQLSASDPPTAQPISHAAGIAKQAGFQVGDLVSLDGVEIVDRPEQFGLGRSPPGHRYAVIDGQLVRLDPGNGKILSILREVEEGSP